MINKPATWLLKNYKKLKKPNSASLEDWEDSKHDGFIKLLNTNRNVNSEKQYVNSTINNTYFRKVTKSSKFIEIDLNKIPTNSNPELTLLDLELELDRIESVNLLKLSIDKLKPRQKEAVLLKLKGNTFEKIAKITKGNINSIKTNYTQGILNIKKLMKGTKWE